MTSYRDIFSSVGERGRVEYLLERVERIIGSVPVNDLHVRVSAQLGLRVLFRVDVYWDRLSWEGGCRGLGGLSGVVQRVDVHVGHESYTVGSVGYSEGVFEDPYEPPTPPR